MFSSRRPVASSSGAAAPAPAPRVVIDLTLSPSPPPRAVRTTGRSSSQRHQPYDVRDRPAREEARDRQGERRREREPMRRPRDAEVIDLDDYPDPEPIPNNANNNNNTGRRNDNSRDNQRLPAAILPEPSLPAHDIEVTIAAHARVRQPSRDPFNPPAREHHHHNYAHHHRMNAASGAPNDPPLDDYFFSPFGRLRPNIGGVASAGMSFFEMVSNMSIPLPRIFAGDASALAPLAPHRDPPDMPDYNVFQAPHDMDYLRVPGFAAVRPEGELEITGQQNNQDKPIPKAREGFTRSPKSEDAIGCSNCDQELGDSDDDLKKQIWVMKCGHCYCGECANAMLSQPRPQKGRKRKIASCAIEKCRQSTAGKKFIWELYP